MTILCALSKNAFSHDGSLVLTVENTNGMLTYSLSKNEKVIEDLAPIIHHPEINCQYLIRIKANCNPRSDRIIKHGFHIDTTTKCTTAIFYVNSNNGYTEFEDGTKVESIENRFVTFPSHLQHTGTTCTDQKRRIVINFNYYEPNE